MGVEEYLRSCRELALLCRQGGWIDNDTLRVEVIERSADEMLAAVSFEEVIMEGAGCVAGRLPCYGRVRLRLSPGDQVEALRVL